MSQHIGALGGIAAIGVALTLVLPLAAQQPAATSGTTPATADAPTTKDPIRFSAFAVSLPAGEAGVVEIAIERWTTDVERQSLLDVLGGASFKEGGQTKLLDALQKVKPRTGYIRTPNSLGWDLKYARENQLPDGTRQVVIATDKPVSFLAAASGSDVMDYPFSFVEMRMKPNDKGEGRLLVASAIDVKDGKVQLENYGQEPVRLTTITQEVSKKKGTERN
jgi:hypothetical protein